MANGVLTAMGWSWGTPGGSGNAEFRRATRWSFWEPAGGYNKLQLAAVWHGQFLASPQPDPKPKPLVKV